MRMKSLSPARAFCLGLICTGMGGLTALAQDSAHLNPLTEQANLAGELASQNVHHLANWIVHANNHSGLPFVIIDKTQAKAFVFHANGRLRGAAPVLLGLAVGDDSVPDIGTRALASIRPDERTTPAGRFVAALDRNLKGKQMLWVDYDTAISLHPVITSNTRERRAERLSSPSPLDNRISYGCINVPAEFFRNVIIPAFTGTDGIVYVLPETRTSQQVFASYDVDPLTGLIVTIPKSLLQANSVSSEK